MRALAASYPGIGLVFALLVGTFITRDTIVAKSHLGDNAMQMQEMGKLCDSIAPESPGLPFHAHYFGAMPEAVAVNWGQAKGPYAYPPERLILCAHGGGGFVWSQHPMSKDTTMRRLKSDEIHDLLPTIMEVWPLGRPIRGEEDGNFLWIVDVHYNLIIAPVMQDRGDGCGVREVKHGDLCPGVNFFGENGVAGPFRGIARLGGELNLAGSRDGQEWVMHSRSGYTAFRVDIDEAREYYDTWHARGQSDSALGANLEACVAKDSTFVAREPMTAIFCHMRRHLHIAVSVADMKRCNIGSPNATVPGFGGLPNLTACQEQPVEEVISAICGDETLSSLRPVAGSSVPLVHLVDWHNGVSEASQTWTERFFDALKRRLGLAVPEASACAWTPSSLDAQLQELNAQMRTAEDLAHVQAALKSLRRNYCFSDPAFLKQLRCNVHGCFGEGFTPLLKAVEDALAKVDSNLAVSKWSHAMEFWHSCLA